ncbi:MAG TPA: hypothetical protein VF741_04840 [Candidatus Aquilonibacter sp.]
MRYLALILTIGFFASIAPARAPAVEFTRGLFRINRCDARANISTSPGFSPGFYPAGRPWFWTDPWGVGFYQPPVTSAHPAMYVDFVNITNKVMTTIVWGLIANGRLVAEARDVGTFSPGVEIKKEYGISINVFPLQTALPQCIALDVRYQDGTRHRNPNLPPRHASIYVSPPPGAGPPASPRP